MAAANSLIAIGRLGKAWGIKGQIVYQAYNEDSEIDLTKVDLFLGDPRSLQKIVLEVLSSKAGKVLLKLVGYDSPEQVKALGHQELWVHRKDLLSLGLDEFYLVDFIACELHSPQGEKLGTVLEFCDFGAGDLLKIQEGSKHYFIPFNKENFLEIDCDNKRLVIEKKHVDPFRNETS